ncbi:MAG: hypothetical protein JWM21_1028 [Acidobacteria bacterium]|nr:hypothetical protein [Acidobacteriota bacterium]
MIRSLGGCLTLVFFLCPVHSAQASQSPTVSNIIAELTRTVEVKSASAGDELILKALSDVIVDGQVVIPKGSKLTGKISEVATRGKDQPQTLLAFVVDKAVRKDGSQIPLQAIVAAIAAPAKDSFVEDPTYGMMHSNEPKMIGSGTTGTASSGALPPSSKASSNAAVATANMKGTMDQPSVLNEDSQGAYGYEGISITWRLLSPPPVTVLATKGKGLKLEAGTQMLLRMAPPRMPR